MSYTRTNWVTGETPLSAGNLNNIEDGIEELGADIAAMPQTLVEKVENIGSPYTFNLASDGKTHGTYLVNVRRYGSESFDGTYWVGIISRLSYSDKNKWAINQIATNSNSAYSVTMSGTTLTITNGTSANNYAYLCITRLG